MADHALVKDTLIRTLLKPGGYKLKAETFGNSMVALERERAAYSCLYERADAARSELVDLIKIMDPLVEDYLTKVTGGRTRYKGNDITHKSGREEQDALLTTIAAACISLQLASMEHDALVITETSVPSVSASGQDLEQDDSTHYSQASLPGLLNVIQSSATAAHFLGVGDLDINVEIPLKREPLVRSERADVPFPVLGLDDRFTTRPSRVHSRSRSRQLGQTSPEELSAESGALVVRSDSRNVNSLDDLLTQM